MAVPFLKGYEVSINILRQNKKGLVFNINVYAFFRHCSSTVKFILTRLSPSVNHLQVIMKYAGELSFYGPWNVPCKVLKSN